MSKQNGVYDWICLEHSQAGYTGDGGCQQCANIRAAKEEIQALREGVARQKGVIDRLHTALGKFSRQATALDELCAKRDERILSLEGTIESLQSKLDSQGTHP